MERRRKIRIGDKFVDATEVGFQTGGEHWNEYLLQDGSVIRLKPVVTEVFRLDGQYDAEGNPVYFVKSASVVSVSASEKTRKPPE